MIDVRRLRDEPEYRRGIERKRVRDGLIDEVLAADDARRALQSAVEELRTRQNAASKEIGKSAPEDRPAKIEAAATLKEELTALEPALADADVALRALALQVPNPADASVPDGGEDDGAVMRVVGEPAEAPPFDHATLAERFGWVDSERGAEASGSRFAYLKGEAVLLELALVQWVMGRLVEEGFTPVVAAGARARARDGGSRVLPDRPQSGLRPPRRRAVPRRHERGASVCVAPRRSPHEQRVADPVRRLLHQLPARGRHVRQGHARDLPRAPVRQARDVLHHHTIRVVGRARANPRHRGISDHRVWGCRTV